MAKELTEKESIFLEVLFEETGRGVPLDDAKWTAQEKAGYSSTFHPNQLLRQLKEEIIGRATEELAMQLPEVIHKVKGVMKEPNQLGMKNMMDAATWIADRAGLVKRDLSTVNIVAEKGIIIMPEKKKD